MITLTREEAQQVLDALKWAADGINTEMTQPYEKDDDCNCPICTTIETLRVKLSEPEPELLGWIVMHEGMNIDELRIHEVEQIGYDEKPMPNQYRVYTAPPQREWVGLTDEEMFSIYGQNHEGAECSLGRLVEAKLKEKNT